MTHKEEACHQDHWDAYDVYGNIDLAGDTLAD